MKKALIILSVIFSILLVSCGETEIPYTLNLVGAISSDAFANDSFVTYATKADYKKGNSYTLQFSVELPEKEGTTSRIILKSTEFKADDNTKILTDGILVTDIKELMAIENEKTLKMDFRDFKYTVSIYDSKNGKTGTGAGTGLSLNKE